jgi:hypothetical protein
MARIEEPCAVELFQIVVATLILGIMLGWLLVRVLLVLGRFPA